jgi:hypothetical protein
MTRRLYNKYHKDAPKDAIYIGRGSPWGNPYVLGKDGERDEICVLYVKNILPSLDLTPLIGKSLVCYCYPKRCHGDAILKKLELLEKENTNDKKTN